MGAKFGELGGEGSWPWWLDDDDRMMFDSALREVMSFYKKVVGGDHMRFSDLCWSKMSSMV